MPLYFCERIKNFIQLAMITKISTLPLPCLRKQTFTLAKQILDDVDARVKAKSILWQCPADGCEFLPFKTKKLQMEHTAKCTNWIK